MLQAPGQKLEMPLVTIFQVAWPINMFSVLFPLLSASSSLESLAYAIKGNDEA